MRKIVAVSAVVAACAISGAANAITVTGHTEDFVTVTNSTNAPQTPDFGVPPGTIQYPTGDSSNTFRSPWEDLFTNAPIQPQQSTLQYTSVFNGSVGYNFTGSSVSLFWGSPDPYNSITFWTGTGGTGSSVTFSGTDLSLYPSGAFGTGHDQVSIFLDTIFHSIVLTSTNPAFEFTNLFASCGPRDETGCTPAPTPLPAALPLLASGIFGVGGLLGWRKRRIKSANPQPA